MTDTRSTLTPEQTAALVAALQVLILDPRTRRHLEDYDPQALAQACAALEAAGAPSTPEGMRAQLYAETAVRLPLACGHPIDAAIVAPCERPAGHGGPCRAYSLEGGAPPAAGLPVDPREASADAAGEWAVDAAMAEAAEREDVAEAAEYQAELDRDYPVPAGLRRRPGVEAGCGKADCRGCYEPFPTPAFESLWACRCGRTCWAPSRPICGSCGVGMTWQEGDPRACENE